MTSNIGTRSVHKGGFGFGKDDEEVDYEKIKSSMMEETKRLFNPEFINRIDEIVVFRPLKRQHILSIIDIAMEEIMEGMKDRSIHITLSSNAKEWLTEKGYDPVYGARQVRRVLRKYIEDPIAEELLRGKFGDESHILVRCKGEELTFVEMEQETTDSNKASSNKPKKVKPQNSN
jgi:ATP-dependent Clp protease ATP-binding subunit ClpC